MNLNEIEKMEPALKEYYWLVQNNKKTEAEFVAEIKHRFNLLFIQLLEQIRDEVVKIIEVGGTGDTITTWKHNGEIYINERQLVQAITSNFNQLIKKLP